MTGSALPGVVLILAATVILALVTFNVPMIKSIYFLQATFSTGDYKGTLKLGTLGYCLSEGGSEQCVGPQIGYNLDLNDMVNLPDAVSNLISIPKSVGKWMTYTLVLHPVALGFGGLATIIGMLDLIPGFAMLCFPTCFATITGAITLIALIFDLALFFILKSTINKVDGAHAEIGQAVWMTLAAWLLACIAGCAYGLSRCCCGGCRRRDDRDSRRDRKRDHDDHSYSESMRMQAIRDEERRKKESSDLPNFAKYEPIPNAEHEDKYLYEERPVRMPSQRGNDIQGVGVGYGRRPGGGHADDYLQDDPYARRDNTYADPYATAAAQPAGPNDYITSDVGYPPSAQYTVNSAGAAGMGAGGAGVERYDQYDPYAQDQYNQPQGHTYSGNNAYNSNQHHDSHDPYARNHDPYAQQTSDFMQSRHAYNNYASPTYPPAAASGSGLAAGIGGGLVAGAVAGAAGAAAVAGHRQRTPSQSASRQRTPSQSGGRLSMPQTPVSAGGHHAPVHDVPPVPAVPAAAARSQYQQDPRQQHGYYQSPPANAAPLATPQAQGYYQSPPLATNSTLASTQGYYTSSGGPTHDYFQPQPQAGYDAGTSSTPTAASTPPLHVPKPQHLITRNQSSLLNEQQQDDEDVPPAYGAVASQSTSRPPEKATFHAVNAL